ncbi:hypothetical protein BCR35DRAFT_352780 [Leucosporidium creatinivorum]|uniref:Uncharacterized protein n=1 Tax=Leucosporidium creatinivorum TaxID=106004 RepID=A0A1Y2F632_9BASI|nr:hypothetical protein BCR35DRAFT_352780 [Leucosporidium creatinivorum]
MSTSSSPGGSRSTSPENVQNDKAAADRLAQLEALLSASMGYGYDEDAPMEDAAAVVDESIHEERIAEDEEPVAAQDEPAPAEQVAFRLFSTQKAPQTVVIKEAEDDWPTVPDRRIRDVADEDKAAVKERGSAIASVAIDGASILAEALSQPLSRHHHRVTARAFTHPAPPAPRPPLPSLAYLNADLPPTATLPSNSADITKPVITSSEARPPQKKRRRPAQPKRQELRRPLASLQDVPLLALPLLQVRKEAKAVVQVAAPVKQVVKEKLKGNKRLSKERRELLRKKLGKNSKKNKRKKAKAKLKAQAASA